MVFEEVDLQNLAALVFIQMRIFVNRSMTVKHRLSKDSVVLWTEPKLVWGKQESIIYALSVSDITQEVINILRRYYIIPYDIYSLVALIGFSGVHHDFFQKYLRMILCIFRE